MADTFYEDLIKYAEEDELEVIEEAFGDDTLDIGVALSKLRRYQGMSDMDSSQKRGKILSVFYKYAVDINDFIEQLSKLGPKNLTKQFVEENPQRAKLIADELRTFVRTL